MTSLTRFKSDNGIELVINTKTGEAFSTQAGYVRMSGKAKSSISVRVQKLVRLGDIKEAEVDTGYGVKLVRLIPADLVYLWISEDNPDLAKAMQKAGTTVYLHQLAGYKISSTAIESKSEQSPVNNFQLPPADIRLVNLADSLKFFGVDPDNPRIKQGLQDLALDILGIGQPALKGENSEVWCGVVERAEQLGYPVGLVTKNRVGLGKWVAKQGLDSKKENRLCNGTQRPINVYQVTPELDSAISTYFPQ